MRRPPNPGAVLGRGGTAAHSAGTSFTASVATSRVALAEVQQRVLGPSLAGSLLFPAIPGYTVLGLRGGLTFDRYQLLIDVEHLPDANCRGPSWGIDAPGRGVSVRLAARV